MNLSFARIILICLLSTVKTFSTEQILLRNITGAYHSVSKPTGQSIVRTTESKIFQAVKLNVGCRVDQVKCYSSDACVSVTRVCDKIRDCIDNSDEIHCYRRPSSTTLKPRALALNCTFGFARCYENSKCIPIISICDGSQDCSDFSDEIDCYRRSTTSTSTTTSLINCSFDQVRCYDNSRCVPVNWICDGYLDCADKSDEIDCYRGLVTTTTTPRSTTTALTCSPGLTRCYDNSKCIPGNWICDMYQDCNDNSDEIDCYRRPTTTTTNRITTTRQSFDSDRMPTTTNARVLSTSIHYSNPMPTTTTNAGTFSTSLLTCQFDYTKCYDNYKCVPISDICDGLPNCPDGSDERDCYRRYTSPTTSTVRPVCSSGQMMCFDNSTCISVTLICNNIQDCADNSDERYCYCGLGQLMCLDGSRCIPVTFVCNNHPDCNDNSDERYCPQILSTTSTTTTSTVQPSNNLNC